MSSATFEKSAIWVYANLLLRLHEMIARGEDESEEADAIRDRMDIAWYMMTREERERVGLLSEDLYTFCRMTCTHLHGSEQCQ